MSDIKWFINNGDYFYFKDAPAHLSGVSLDKSEISLTTVGQTEQLTATIIPANPVETVSLNWSSSDTSIATVDNTGLVTCVTPGECTITVTTTPGSYTASCNVKSVTVIYCDFTQSDNGFVFNARTSSNASYGWNSNGLYAYRNTSCMEAVGWRVPASISSLGTLKKFEVVLYRTGGVNLGGGLVIGADTTVMRYWNGELVQNFGTTTSVATAGTSVNVEYTLTIDLENKEMYMTNSSTKLTLPDDAITNFNTQWNNGNINICSMIYSTSGAIYTYLKNATFYI